MRAASIWHALSLAYWKLRMDNIRTQMVFLYCSELPLVRPNLTADEPSTSSCERAPAKKTKDRAWDCGAVGMSLDTVKPR